MNDIIAQIGIVVFGLIGYTLLARKNKFGFLILVFAQPFYFYTSVIHKQWGLFITTILYTIISLYGVYNWLIKKEYKKCSFCQGTGRWNGICSFCKGTGRIKK